MRESLRIISQCLNKITPGAVKVDDHKLVPPPRAMMKESMESLIHHFKARFSQPSSTLLNDTFPPAFQWRLFSSSWWNLQCHRGPQRWNGRLSGFVRLSSSLLCASSLTLNSDGTNRPYRCSIRAPGFAHLAGSDFMMRRMYLFLSHLQYLTHIFTDVSYSPCDPAFSTNLLSF